MRVPSRVPLAVLLAGLFACMPAPESGDTAASDASHLEDANKAVVMAMIEAVNARDLDALDALVAPDVRRHSPSTPGLVVEDRAAFKAFLENDFGSVPDSRIDVTHMLADDDMVSVWATYAGTQDGPMGPFPATGNAVSLEYAGFLRIEDGMIAEMWVVWDNLGMLVELGHLEPPGPPVGG